MKKYRGARFTFTYKRGRNRGSLLIETLCALLIGLLTGAALLSLMQLTMNVRSSTSGPGGADAEARTQLDKLCDRLRNSQSNVVGSAKQVFSAAATSDLTMYSDTSGSTLRLWLDTSSSPYVLKQTTVVAGTTTTTTILSGVTALQFSYYQQTSASYNAASGSYVSTSNSHSPTTAERPYLCCVNVSITVGFNGFSRNIYSLVRLRNSPLS